MRGPFMITSSSNAQVKNIIALNKKAKERREQRLAVAFIYLSDELIATSELEEKMKIALARISEKLSS